MFCIICCRLVSLGCLVALLFGHAQSSVTTVKIQDNVVFSHLSDINLSRSRWLLTFVIDLQPYGRFMSKLEEEINNASILCNSILKYYSNSTDLYEYGNYLSIFRSLNNEVLNIGDLHDEIKSSFIEYKSLHDRKKRSLLPFVGDVMSTLFGTISESDLDGIRHNIRTLSSNQERLSHIVAKSLTIINLSNFEIKKNRQSINEIIDTLGSIDNKINVITEQLQSQIINLKRFTYMYTKLQLVVQELSAAIQRSLHYYTHLQIQLNALSLQKLSPNLIGPANLRLILSQIADQLPESIGLPSDIDTGLWNYYKNIACYTFIEAEQIIIVAEIPLVDFTQKFELYRVFSIPGPLISNKTIEDADLLGYYKIESQYFAVNHQRTRYVMLNENQAKTCYETYAHVCKIREPQYLTNNNNNCVVSLFMGDRESRRKHCNLFSKLTKLPKAIHFADDLYIVLTKEPMKVFISCTDDNSKKEIKIHPPVGILQLGKTCVATNKYLALVGYYENKLTFRVESEATRILQSYRFDGQIWNKFEKVVSKSLPNVTIPIPKRLTALPEIPMDELVREVENLQKVKPLKSRKFPLWGYLLIGIAFFLVWVIGRYIYKRYLKPLLVNCCCRNSVMPNRARELRQVTPAGLQREAVSVGSTGGARNAGDAMQMSALLEDDDGEQTDHQASNRVFPALVLAKGSQK